MEKNYHTLRWPDQAIVLSWVGFLLHLPFTFLYILKPWMFSEHHKIVVFWMYIYTVLTRTVDMSTILGFQFFGAATIQILWFLLNKLQKNLGLLFKCVYYSSASTLRVVMVCEKIDNTTFLQYFKGPPLVWRCSKKERKRLR